MRKPKHLISSGSDVNQMIKEIEAEIDMLQSVYFALVIVLGFTVMGVVSLLVN